MAGIYHKATKRVLVIIDAIPVTFNKQEGAGKACNHPERWLLKSKV
jgi:hypothetical protein